MRSASILNLFKLNIQTCILSALSALWYENTRSFLSVRGFYKLPPL